MLVVVCENPRCGKSVPKHTAQIIKDEDFWEHYACPNPVCITRAILAIEAKEYERKTFEEAIENCR